LPHTFLTCHLLFSILAPFVSKFFSISLIQHACPRAEGGGRTDGYGNNYLRITLIPLTLTLSPKGRGGITLTIREIQKGGRHEESHPGWERSTGRGFITFFLLVSLFLSGSGLSLAAGVDYPTKPVLCIAPAKPGSGFDTTIRAVTTTLGKEKLISVALPVENMSNPVAGMATIMLRHKNNPYMIAVQSLSGLLSYASGMSPYSHKDWTPIARLISAYYGVMVRYDSPYKTLGDLVRDLKENIGKSLSREE